MPQPDLSSVVRVLIVEDNPDDAFILHEAISQLGLRCDIQVAENAVQVFRRMRDLAGDEAPDLAIVDVNLPVITGTTVVREIRDHQPWEKTRVVVLSGTASEQDFRLCAALGAQECLPKPTSFTGYLALAQRWCAHAARPLHGPDPGPVANPLTTSHPAASGERCAASSSRHPTGATTASSSPSSSLTTVLPTLAPARTAGPTAAMAKRTSRAGIVPDSR